MTPTLGAVIRSRGKVLAAVGAEIVVFHPVAPCRAPRRYLRELILSDSADPATFWRSGALYHRFVGGVVDPASGKSLKLAERWFEGFLVVLICSSSRPPKNHPVRDTYSYTLATT